MGLMGTRLALAVLLPWVPQFCLASDPNDYLNKAARAYSQLRSFQVEAMAESDREIACRTVRVRVPVSSGAGPSLTSSRS